MLYRRFAGTSSCLKEYPGRLFLYISLIIFLHFAILQPFCLATAPSDTRLVFDRKAAPGPWGNLEISYIRIAPPIDYVPELQIATDCLKWHFPEWDELTLKQFIANAPLPEQTRQTLIQKIRPNLRSAGVIIEPSESDIINLSPEARAYIYNRLSTYKINYAHDKVHRYASPSLNEWMYGVNLSKSTRVLLEKLVYRNGNILFFADMPILMKNIPTNAERREVFQALSCEKTILLKLRITDDSDTHALAQYWGGGARAKEIYPLLESIRNRPGDRSLDVVHLLPPFVRRHIYMYPDLDHDFGDSSVERDCHWTSLNFFNLEINNDYGKSAKIKQRIESAYRKIDKNELRLGDILLYLDAGRLLHSAVFIADDIVFTKNGTSYSSPWMFMHTEDMKMYYAPRKDSVKVLYLRKKDSPSSK